MSFSPEFKGPIEGWVVNQLTKNYWKVERTHKREDVMQEAYLIFLRLSRHYEGAIETPQHFMALFKTSWTHHFTDMANADTASRVFVEMPRIQLDGDVVEYEPGGDADNDGALAVLLGQAPREVLMVLNLFLNAPQELLDIALSTWKGNDKRCKAGGSKRINKMLGLPEDIDVMKTVEDFLKP